MQTRSWLQSWTSEVQCYMDGRVALPPAVARSYVQHVGPLPRIALAGI